MFFTSDKSTSSATPDAHKAHLAGIDEFFSDQFRRILIAAAAKAKAVSAQDIDTEFLLFGLIEKRDAVIDKILEKLGVNFEELSKALAETIKVSKNPPAEHVLFSPRSKNTLELCDKARREFSHHATSSEHLLLALVREGDGVAARILKKFGLTQENVVDAILKIVGKGQEKDVLKGNKTPMLDEFGSDLCEKAREGKLDPVIGRGEEIERTIHILARRRKNNPVLVGEPGVGKTAIVEGLANRIVLGDVPESLKGKRIIEVSMNTLLAGASHRGEFEKRLQDLIQEARDAGGEVILFIDEIHTLISEGENDAANVFKPALARGELHCVGATTISEYHQYIEKDAALERRLQMVRVPEPSFDDTFQILQGLRDKYEAFHKVKISDEILRLAIMLTDRYINDRFLPDKAVDLIDEAATVAKMPSLSVPEKIKKLEKEIEHLQGEREQAKKNINMDQIMQIEKDLSAKEVELKEAKETFDEDKARSHDEVLESHLQEVLSQWTGMPLSNLKSSESEKLLKLEEQIHQHLIGQEEAVSAVCKAVRRGRSGLKKVNLPIGSFLFLGPTGVGKTQIAKTLAESLFGMESALIRFDMSEFMEKHAVSRLLGPPPGYIGYEKGGELTEAARKKPFSVILFDEVEKAHPDVFRIFLQLLDEGHLTDSHGRVVSFKNSIIICTSNLAAATIVDFVDSHRATTAEEGQKNSVELKKLIMPEIFEFFRPELVNRFDEMVIFEPLREEQMADIVDIFLQDTHRALNEKGLAINLTVGARKFIAEAGFDPQFGARPLKRALQKLIDDPLSEKILANEFVKGDSIFVDVEGQGDDRRIVFEKNADKKEAGAISVTSAGDSQDPLAFLDNSDLPPEQPPSPFLTAARAENSSASEAPIAEVPPSTEDDSLEDKLFGGLQQ